MPRSCQRTLQWLNLRIPVQNLIPAVFHMITISLISTSMVQLPWFVISGGVCTPVLTLGQFFWFGYMEGESSTSEFDCINATIVNLMRTIILLCFMAIIFSMGGFFLDILEPHNSIHKFVRRYALASTCTVFWIMAIISICYYVTVLLEESLESVYPKTETEVVYGCGFYLIALTGGGTLIGTFFTLMLMQSAGRHRGDRNCLISRYDDALESFDSPTPPPPYSIPPPPYTP